MPWILVLVGVSFVGAIAINTAVHWPRARAQREGNRKTAARLSVRGLIDETVATALVLAGPLATWLPNPKPAQPAQPTSRLSTGPSATIILLPEQRLPTSSAWLLTRRLRKLGWQVTVRRPRTVPSDTASTERLADAILTRTAADESVTLLAIGASGLIARQLAANAPRFRRIVTVATPHSGTTCPLLPAATRPDAPYLRTVTEMDRSPRAFDAIAIYSGGDAWLEPTEGGYYPGAYNIEIKDIGHLSMLSSSRVLGLIHENLEAALPAPD